MNGEMFLFYKAALQGEITNPLCADYKSEWRKCGDDKQKLVDLVLRQQSLPYYLAHCHQGKGLSKEYILKTFADYINGAYTAIDVDGVKGDYRTQIYVGYNDDLLVSLDVVAFQWCNIPSFTVPQCKATKMYVGCSSEVHLVCDGYNSIVVMLFDDSTLYLDDIDENSGVTIYRYSKDAKVEVGKFCFSTKIKQFDKPLKL